MLTRRHAESVLLGLVKWTLPATKAVPEQGHGGGAGAELSWNFQPLRIFVGLASEPGQQPGAALEQEHGWNWQPRRIFAM